MSGAVAVGQVWQDVHNGRNVRIAAVEGDEVAYTGGESSMLSSYVWYFMRHHRLVTADVPMPEVEQGETKGEVEHG